MKMLTREQMEKILDCPIDPRANLEVIQEALPDLKNLLELLDQAEDGSDE